SRPKSGPILIDPLSKTKKEKKKLRLTGSTSGLNSIWLSHPLHRRHCYISSRSYSWGSPQLATSNQGYYPWHKLHLFFPCTIGSSLFQAIQCDIAPDLKGLKWNPHPVESFLMIMVSFHLFICQRCFEGWVVCVFLSCYITSARPFVDLREAVFDHGVPNA
ncbi:hypothetical protein LB507_008533, partial [Fusarium sp. FIESC RH6]